MQAQGCGLRGGTSQVLVGHPEGAVSPACPGHGDLAVGVVHQAQGTGLGSWGLGQAIKSTSMGSMLTAGERWATPLVPSKKYSVIGGMRDTRAGMSSESCSGKEGWVGPVLQLLPLISVLLSEKATRAPHMSHPLTTNDAHGTVEHGTAQGLLEKGGVNLGGWMAPWVPRGTHRTSMGSSGRRFYPAPASSPSA